jgi:ADP-ribose pyrophosphatase YjhB (NUDIX family)
MKPKWLEWAMQLQSIAQAGLTFSHDRYDLERFEQIRALSVEIMHEYTGVSNQQIKTLFANESGYQTPKVDIRASVFKDDRILLIREKIDGAWALPGGWADVNTTVGESVIRECTEEAGAEVIPRRIIAVLLANKHNDPLLLYTTYKIIVECDLVKSEFHENTETLEAGFFTIDNIPDLSTGRTTLKQIELCFKAKKHKLFEPVFD